MDFPNKEEIRQDINKWGEDNKDFIADKVKNQPKSWRDLPNELNKPEVLEEKRKMFDLAFALYHEVKTKTFTKKKDYFGNSTSDPNAEENFFEEKNGEKNLNARHRKMGEKYKILYEKMPSLYMIAIMEELENPKYTPIIDIFIKNKENPAMIRKELESLESAEVNQSITNFAEKNAESTNPDIKEFLKSFNPDKLPNSTHSGYEKDTNRSREDLIKKYSKK